ncbi:MAG: PQQ-dependent sugar dehydrogenase [Thermoleophilia bacterium]
MGLRQPRARSPRSPRAGAGGAGALRRSLLAIALVGLAAVVAPLAPAAAHVPDGFATSVFARAIDRPTAMAWGPDGRLYATLEGGAVVSFARSGGRPRPFLGGLEVPLGLVWLGDDLYVAQRGRVEAVTMKRGKPTRRRAILRGLPHGLHQQDALVVGEDGRIYLGSGSTCDACAEASGLAATVLSFRPNGSDLRVEARGLRNPYGLAVQPGTGEIYVSTNGRDTLDGPSGPEPADSVVRLRRGADFGWPSCWPSARLLRLRGACKGVTPPVAYLEPHAGAAGMAFYDGDAFPAAYHGDLFVAEWGQFLFPDFGREVTRIELRPNRAARVTAFATGIEHPIAVAVHPDGSLLVADYGTFGRPSAGSIIRIRAT